MSNKFFNWLERSFLPIMAKIGNNRYVVAIKDGFISAMPMMIVGSFLLILAYPPIKKGTNFFLAKAWLDFATKYSQNLLTPYRMTMGIMTIFISLGIGYSLARTYKLDSLSGSMVSLMSFLLVAATMKDGVLPSKYLGGAGIFTALFVSIYSVEVMRFLKQRIGQYDFQKEYHQELLHRLKY